MIFEYDQQPMFMQSIEIEDLGNVALRCSTSAGREYIIVIKTYLGKTIILKFGPVYAGLDVLPDTMELSFKKLDYKETVIQREISKYINDVKAGINNVAVVSEYEALAQLPTADTFLASL